MAYVGNTPSDRSCPAPTRVFAQVNTGFRSVRRSVGLAHDPTSQETPARTQAAPGGQFSIGVDTAPSSSSSSMLCAQAETSMELGTKGGKGGGWPRSRVYGTAVESTVHSICESLPRTVARISLRTFCGPLTRSCPRPSMTLATKETSPVMRLRPPQVGTRWLLKLMPVRAGRSVAGVGGHDRWGGVEFFGEEL